MEEVSKEYINVRATLNTVAPSSAFFPLRLFTDWDGVHSRGITGLPNSVATLIQKHASLNIQHLLLIIETISNPL